tara:strand:- start:94 stop:501 length:408 start_codon:yes stop_codon:yes gene_type:complete
MPIVVKETSPAFEKIRDEAMEFARKNDLDEVEAQKHLRRKLKQAGVALPPSMATDEEFKQQMKETEKFRRNKRLEGGAIKKAKKPQMMKGGMANGKVHMYAAGGNVTDKLPNKGLKQLAKTEKGKAAVRNMGFDV